jgi:hypothetical protein
MISLNFQDIVNHKELNFQDIVNYKEGKLFIDKENKFVSYYLNLFTIYRVLSTYIMFVF